MEAQGLLPHVDELVMEYLLFRGFTKSFQAFAGERRRDRARGFDADQILSQLLLAIQSYQVESVLETWKFLSARFFHHLDASYAATLQKLETSLLRLYVVNAVKTGHREKAAEFFKRFANRLHATIPLHDADGSDSWARWFVLPYIEHPETDPYFQVFFSKEWLEAFVTSFRNFMGLVFRSLPLPKLLAFQLSRLHDPTLKVRLKVSQAECSRLRVLNVEATSKIKTLEEAGRQLHSILRMMVQHSFLEHFKDSSGSPPPDEPSDGLATSKGAPRRRIQYQANHLGLSRDQMRELGELFGVSTKENTTSDMLFAADNERALGSGQLLPEEERPSDDAFAVDSEPGGVMSPPFSPIPGMGTVAVLEPHAELSDDSGSSDDRDAGPSEFWEGSAATPKPGQDGQRGLKVSLIRELNLLNNWEPSASAMAMRSRFSRDGKYLAISQIGNSHVDIWRAEGVDLSPSSTLSLQHELTHLAWINAGDGEQAMLCSLRNHSINVWRIGSGELLSTLPADRGARIAQLACAKNGSTAVCLYEYDQDDAPSVAEDGDSLSQDVRILNASAGELSSRTAVRGSGEISCLAVSDCGRLAILGTARGQFRFIGAGGHGRVEEWTPPAEELGESSVRAVVAMCFSPDATSMLSAHASSCEVLEWGIRSFVSKFSEDTGSTLEDSRPTVVCRYDLGQGIAGLEDARGLVTIRFLGGGDFFTVSDANRLRLFKRGQVHPVDIGQLDHGALADLDWHPTLPVCSTVNQDGTVALWDIQEFGSTVERKEIGI